MHFVYILLIVVQQTLVLASHHVSRRGGGGEASGHGGEGEGRSYRSANGGIHSSSTRLQPPMRVLMESKGGALTAGVVGLHELKKGTDLMGSGLNKCIRGKHIDGAEDCIKGGVRSAVGGCLTASSLKTLMGKKDKH